MSLATDCLGLPNASSAASSSSAQVGDYLTAFHMRPAHFYPHWGGATGFANKLITVTKRHASFAAVLDIGCNTGEWTKSWLGRDGRGGRENIILCVEALPSLVSPVRQKLRRHAGGERIQVVNVALSNVSGESRPLFGLPASAKSARAPN